MLDEDETTNEKSFSSTYRESLMHAIYVFKKNLDDVSKAWEPFKKVIIPLKIII
jgi:hypothetical protein